MKESSSLSHSYEIGMEIARFEIEVEKGSQATKKTYYLALFNDLSSNNTPKEDVVRKAHEIIEHALQTLTKDSNTRFTNDSYFYRVARENNYEGVQEHSENSSDSVPELSGECVRERLQYIEFMDDIIQRAQANKELLKEDYYFELDEHGNQIGTSIKYKWGDFFTMEGKDEIMKFIKDVFYNEQKEWQQMVDTRQAIIPRMRFFIAALYSVVTNSDFCEGYYSKVKDKMHVTPKKRTQFWNDLYTAGKTFGMVANSKAQLFDLFKRDAFKWHFIDVSCPDCGKKRMRIKLKENGTWWLVCPNADYHHIDETLFPATLFGDRIEQLMNNVGGAATNFLSKNDILVKSN